MSTKAVLLSRVSTLSQDLASQTNDIVRDAHYRGFTDDEIVIIEDKESAIKLSEAERNGINTLKECIEEGGVSAVFVWELTRLSRQLPMLYSLRDYLQQHKVQLYCHKPEFKLFNDDWSISDMSNVCFAMFAVLAENEMRVKQERMARGRNELKRTGYAVGSKVPFGYKKEREGRRSKIVIDKENAKIVKQMFKLAQTYTPIQIWEWLKSIGVTVHRYHVKNMLSNKAYINQAVDIHGNHIEHPVILTEEEFYAVNKDKERRKCTRHYHVCEQLIVCEKCGAKYQVNSHSYECHNHSNGVKRFTPRKYCDNSLTLPISYTDNLCIYVAKCCYLKDIRTSSVQRKREISKEIKENEKKIAVIDKTLNGIDKKIKKIAAMYEDDVYTYEEYKSKVADIRTDVKHYQTEKQRLESRNTSLLSDLNEFNIKTYTRTEQSALADKIFNDCDMSPKELFDLTHKYIKSIRFKTVEGSKTKKILCFETTNYDNFYYMYQGNGRNFCIYTTSEILCKDFDHVTEYDLTEEFETEKAGN